MCVLCAAQNMCVLLQVDLMTLLGKVCECMGFRHVHGMKRRVRCRDCGSQGRARDVGGR